MNFAYWLLFSTLFKVSTAFLTFIFTSLTSKSVALFTFSLISFCKLADKSFIKALLVTTKLAFTIMLLSLSLYVVHFMKVWQCSLHSLPVFPAISNFSGFSLAGNSISLIIE